MRLLTANELMIVAGGYGSSGVGGGDIVVVGDPGDGSDISVDDGSVVSSLLPPNEPDESIVDWEFEVNPEPGIPTDTDGDGVIDSEDADPNDPQVQAEIVVNGVRIDSMSDGEIRQERNYYLWNGVFANAEWVPDSDGVGGEWIYIPTPNPTADQALFKANFDLTKSQLWYKDQSFVVAIANALTNAGVNALDQGLALPQLVGQYQSLVDSGELMGRTASDFVQWLIQGGVVDGDQIGVVDNDIRIIFAPNGNGGVEFVRDDVVGDRDYHAP